jgi:hypothetical protein
MLKKLKLVTRDWALSNKKKFPQNRNFRMLTMCKKCYTFYYKNSWHFESPNYLNIDSDKELPVRFTQCPACLEQEQALYERELENIVDEPVSMFNSLRKGNDEFDSLAWNN